MGPHASQNARRSVDDKVAGVCPRGDECVECEVGVDQSAAGARRGERVTVKRRTVGSDFEGPSRGLYICAIPIALIIVLRHLFLCQKRVYISTSPRNVLPKHL